MNTHKNKLFRSDFKVYFQFDLRQRKMVCLGLAKWKITTLRMLQMRKKMGSSTQLHFAAPQTACVSNGKSFYQSEYWKIVILGR